MEILKKILTTSLVLTSIACNDIKVKPIPSPKVSTVTPTASPSPSVITLPSPSNMPTPSPTITETKLEPSPSMGNYGYTDGGITRLFLVEGKVFDKNKITLENVKVSIKITNEKTSGYIQRPEYITQSDGFYFLKGLVDGSTFEITAQKTGYKTVTRTGIVDSVKFDTKLGSDRFNFGGEGDDAQYALEKVN